MSTIVRKSSKLKWSIIVDEIELRRLDEAIHLSCSPLDKNDEFKLVYTITCSDGSAIQVNDIDSVIQENNSKEARIDSIAADVYTIDNSKHITINLGEKIFDESINYSVTGNSRDWVYLTTSKICDRFKNMKQWYTPISKINWWMPTIAFTFILYIYSNLQEKVETTTISLIEVVIVIFITACVIYIVPHYLNKLTRYLFPPHIFRIGDGIKKHDKLISLRANLFWGVIVTLTISIVVSFFFNNPFN